MPTYSLRAVAALTACVLASAALPASSNAAKDDLVLVSLPSLLGDPPSTEASTSPAVSSSGRVIAFESSGDTLSQADNNALSNVFVRDVETNVTTLISRQTGTGGASAGANNTSDDVSISGDGRYVTFTSTATNLAADDLNASSDVFLRDTVTNTTTLVSRAPGSTGAPGDGISISSAISRDGRMVAFTSIADNLSTDDNNAVANVFVRDLVTNTTTLVSRGAAGAAADSSGNPAISADGRYVAFQSIADNLSTDDNNAVINIFVRDLVAGTTTLVTRQTGETGTGADNDGVVPSISDDGTQIAFFSPATNLSTEGSNTSYNVFVRNWATATTTLVSRASGVAGAAGTQDSYNAAISGDGKRVAFESEAPELSSDDTDGINNVFVRDLANATTTFVSRGSGASGAAATTGSGNAAINVDGRYVAFHSGDAALSTLDHDPTVDVFLRDVLGDPPPPPAATPPTAPPVPATPPAAAPKVNLALLLTGPSTKRCLSTRRLTLRLKNASQITKLTIKVTGVRKTTTVRGTKLRAAINLTGLPRGRYTVTVTATLTDGTTQKVTRTYRTCASKKG